MNETDVKGLKQICKPVRQYHVHTLLEEPNWQQLSYLFVCFCNVRGFNEEWDFLENFHSVLFF